MRRARSHPGGTLFVVAAEGALCGSALALLGAPLWVFALAIVVMLAGMVCGVLGARRKLREEARRDA
jgi:hypothetical protein